MLIKNKKLIEKINEYRTADLTKSVGNFKISIEKDYMGYRIVVRYVTPKVRLINNDCSTTIGANGKNFYMNVYKQIVDVQYDDDNIYIRVSVELTKYTFLDKVYSEHKILVEQYITFF